MKKIVEDTEDGMESLLGERVLLLCCNYFYCGQLVGVNSTCVKLKDPQIVYETGNWSDEGWKDSQSMNMESIYVQLHAIESFGKITC